MGAFGGGITSAEGAPRLEEHVEKTGLTPAPDAIHPFNEQQSSDSLKGLSPEEIVSNPQKIVEFVQKNPERLDPKTMEPAVILTVAQLLMESGAWLSAERLLDGAIALHTQRTDLKRASARVLIQLGRANSALRRLETVRIEDADQPEYHFLLGLAVLRAEPTPRNQRERAVAAFEKVLSLEPNYRDGSGWTARELRGQLQRLNQSAAGAIRPSAP